MDCIPSTPSPEDATARHRALLSELVDMGMDMARLLHRQAHAPRPEDPATPQPEPAAPVQAELFTAFDRIARCVRRTVLLAEHIARPAPARHATPANDDTGPATRRRMLRRVDDLIAEYVPPGPRADALHAEAAERVEGLDIIEDLRFRTIGEVAYEICCDLQLFGRNTRRRTPADIARALARAAGDPAPEPPTRPETGPPAWVHKSEARRPAPPPADPTVAILERLARQG